MPALMAEVTFTALDLGKNPITIPQEHFAFITNQPPYAVANVRFQEVRHVTRRGLVGHVTLKTIIAVIGQGTWPCLASFNVLLSKEFPET
jgi:hypothetical protein